MKSQKQVSPFACIKLKNGETLFVELKGMDEEALVVHYPYLVRLVRSTNESESLLLSPWIPFTDDIEFAIPISQMMYMGELNSFYLKFYGSSRFREELIGVKQRGFDRLEDGELKSTVLKDMAKEVEKLGHDYSIKFGLDPDSVRESVSFDDEPENIQLH